MNAAAPGGPRPGLVLLGAADAAACEGDACVVPPGSAPQETDPH